MAPRELWSYRSLVSLSDLPKFIDCTNQYALPELAGGNSCDHSDLKRLQAVVVVVR